MDSAYSTIKARPMLFYLVLLLSGLISFSQTSGKSLNEEDIPEKIYLQLSSKEFTINQNIWFKAIVTDSRNHFPSERSGVLYVDLINANSEVVAHKIIKLTNGIGQGSFDLKPRFNGQFLIRAYTEWNRNFGSDFMFEQYVTIYKLTYEKEEDPFAGIELLQNLQDQNFLTGQVQFTDNTKRNADKVKVKLNWGTGKDSTWLIKRGQNGYTLNHEIPNDLSWISLESTDKLGRHFLKTVILNDSTIDLQFFPESGKMVNGIKTKVGFKAIGFDGKGRKVNGIILDNQGNKITSFKSNSLGMGFFYLKPENEVSYNAQLTTETFTNTNKNLQLPRAVRNGSALSVWKTRDQVRFRVASTNLKDSVAIKVSCRGVDYFLIEGLLVDGRLISEIPSENIPNGIIVFTLLNQNGQPIAERLFYNESGTNENSIEITTDKSKYSRRERTKIEILSKVEQSSTFNMSVKVINKNQWRNDLDGFIQSYFHLESELKGIIENPGHYFDKSNSSRLTDLEALLLTQGWRNYKYPAKRQGNYFFWPQTGLMVKGKVNIPSAKNVKRNTVDLTLATFGTETALYTQRTDTLGNFQFLLEDDFGQRMRILLQAQKNGKRTIKHNLWINSFSAPKVRFEYNPFLQDMDPISRTILDEGIRRNNSSLILDSLYGVTQLDEVVVEDYFVTPERRKIHEKYGKPDVIIKGDSLVKQEKKWSYGLYSILMFNYGDQLQIERFPDGFMLAHIAGGPTLLMVDGRLIQSHEYENVPHMPTGIIENIELIKFAKFFKSRYLTAFPETSIMEAPYVGHIISINTKGKVGMQGTNKPIPGTLDTTIDVFSPIKQFYTPKYDKAIPINEQQPDLRSLIHWSAILNMDEDGKLSESFYNGDVPGEFVIIVEAISDDGHIGYQTKTYSVKE